MMVMSSELFRGQFLAWLRIRKAEVSAPLKTLMEGFVIWIFGDLVIVYIEIERTVI